MKKLLLAALLALTSAASQASPVITYAGSWQVGQGPVWFTNPLAYSGVGTAQLLFGAGTYYISTRGDQVADINHMANYAIIGIDFADFAEDYFRGTEGTTHYMDVYDFDPNTDTVSAYVNDFGTGGTNYAFRVTDDGRQVPEPAGLALLGLGLAGVALARRRKALLR
jgi:hypothetical protein